MNKKQQIVFISFALFFWGLFPLRLSADNLEEEVSSLKRIVQAQSTNMAEAINQNQQILNQFQTLKGQIEQSLHQNKNQERKIQELTRMVEVAEDKAQLLLKQLEEIKVAGGFKAAQTKRMNEYKSFEIGVSFLNQGQFEKAQKSLSAFLKKYPRSIFAASARYWIGESYFAMGDYPKAIDEYEQVIKNFKSSSKVPHAMLKQGFAFFEMNQITEAEIFLNRLIQTYPKHLATQRANQKLRQIKEMQKAKEQKENLSDDISFNLKSQKKLFGSITQIKKMVHYLSAA